MGRRPDLIRCQKGSPATGATIPLLGERDDLLVAVRLLDHELDVGVESGGTGALLVQAAGPRTQDILQVARHVYTRGLTRGRVEPPDVEAAIADVVREEDPVIRSIWMNLTAHQQNVLRAVVSGAEQVFSSAVRVRFGLPTSSTVASAVDALEKRGLLARERESGTIAFDSPFVRRWVEAEALGDVPPTV